MGPEGEQAALEEDPLAPLPPRPLPFDRLGLHPLSVELSRSIPNHAVVPGSEGERSRRTILFECRGGSRGRVRYFLSLPISAVFSISFMFFGSPEG